MSPAEAALNRPTQVSSRPIRVSMGNRILVVEDEFIIREMVAAALQNEGYEVSMAADGAAAMKLLNFDNSTEPFEPPDLIILDLMLPEVNGLDLCRWLRQRRDVVPILILSAKGSESDRVLGLEAGADDYLTKPFGTRELIARCRAMLRRQEFLQPEASDRMSYEDIELYPQECRVLCRGEAVNLSPKEYRLLELFMGNLSRVWSREQLLEQVWGLDFAGDSKTVDVHVRWLREKIESDPSAPKYLVTVRGFGYRFG